MLLLFVYYTSLIINKPVLIGFLYILIIISTLCYIWFIFFTKYNPYNTYERAKITAIANNEKQANVRKVSRTEHVCSRSTAYDRGTRTVGIDT